MQTWQELDRNAWLVGFRTALAAGRDLPQPPLGHAGPFGLADVDGATEMLGAAGFDPVAFTSVEAPMIVGTDFADAWDFVQTMGIFRGLTQGLDDATKAGAVKQLKQLLADNETPDGVLLGAASWIITARRR